jgi:hypothetical protein
MDHIVNTAIGTSAGSQINVPLQPVTTSIQSTPAIGSPQPAAPNPQQ